MRLLSFAAGLACLALLAGRPAAGADSPPPSPLRLVPAEADFFVQAANPSQAVEVALKLDVIEQLQTFPFVKEQLDSTGARRARQLLAYFEKQLGAKYPELLHDLAGGGIVLAGKYGNNAPALLVIQGRDEKLMEKAHAEVLTIIEGELARQEAKEGLVQDEVRDQPVHRIGQGFWMARQGRALLLSNKKEALALALDLGAGRGKNSLAASKDVQEAARLLPDAPLVNAWFNMKPVHASAKDLYAKPRDNPQLTVLFGSYLDVLGRSPFVAVGVHRTKDGFLTTIRAPRGREGMGAEAGLFLPPEGQPGSLPLLEPPGVLYSNTFYLDMSRIWTDREKLFLEAQAKGLENFDKTSGRVLAGAKLSELLTTAGARHRTVVANQGKSGYTRKPKQAIPAFAFVSQLREPEKFARKMEPVLRAGGLLASMQVALKLQEEKHAGVDVVGYRFDEKAELKQDVNDTRFNFSPCFARVGDQFIFCSTIELCRDLIDLIHKEQEAGAKGYPETHRARVYAGGAATLLEAAEDQLVTQTILDQAVPPGEARAQVKKFIALVRSLGHLQIASRFTKDQTHYEFRITK